MPTKIRVKNFQSIEDATVEIEGFTVVTGKNNSGKSACMRAIRGVFQNTKGSRFVRNGSEKTEVEVVLANGKSACWSKGRDSKSKPAYVVNGEGPIFPGQAVPEELSDLGIYAIQAGGRDIWPQFAPQFSGQVFLLDQPGSVLAESVSDVERVSKLNNALRKAESDKNALVSEIKVRSKDQLSLEKQLALFDGFDQAVSLLKEAEDKQKHLEKIEKTLEILNQLFIKREQYQSIINSLSGVLGISTLDDSIFLTIRETEVKIGELTRILDKILRLRSECHSIMGVSKLSCSVEFEKPNRMLEAVSVLEGLASKRLRVKTMIEKQQSELSGLEVELSSCQQELDAFVGSMKKCPTCGSVTLGEPHHVFLDSSS